MCGNNGSMLVHALPLLLLLLFSSGTNVVCLSLRESRIGEGGGGVIGSSGRVISSHIPTGIGRSSSFTSNKMTNVKGMATDLGDKHLQLYGVEVPVYKFRGEDAQLECKYDRGNDPLYSVKWYKDDDEFYRYLFRQKSPKQTFIVPGVVVDIHRSNERRVLLKDLTFNSTGVYRCEVSADSPHFHTYTNQSVMVVVELPERGPTISGGRLHYRVGDMVRLNCTSSRSKPAATLTWFINGIPASQNHLVPYFPWIHEDGLESRRLGLHFKVDKDHFLKDVLILKCQATVAAIYSAVEEEDATVYENEPVILEQREDLLTARSAVAAVLPTFSILVVLAILVGEQAVT
ncbi:uncharacterized protein [Macrobrachium rosenbergii]|uniref:uncharacterized protein n=1 Tax=Macrobrachium rosenbergii TaxID=79674 RepID=UPI0034D5B1C1